MNKEQEAIIRFVEQQERKKNIESMASESAQKFSEKVGCASSIALSLAGLPVSYVFMGTALLLGTPSCGIMLMPLTVAGVCFAVSKGVEGIVKLSSKKYYTDKYTQVAYQADQLTLGTCSHEQKQQYLQTGYDAIQQEIEAAQNKLRVLQQTAGALEQSQQLNRSSQPDAINNIISHASNNS